MILPPPPAGCRIVGALVCPMPADEFTAILSAFARIFPGSTLGPTHGHVTPIYAPAERQTEPEPTPP